MSKATLIEANAVESFGTGYRDRAPDLERKVIGACFRRPSQLQLVTANLTAESFSDPRHKAIYGYIAEIAQSGKFPDRDVCLARVRQNTDFDIDSEDYEEAIRLAYESETDIDLESACHAIHDLHVVRQIRGFAKRIEANVSDGRPSDQLIGSAEEFIRKISSSSTKSSGLMSIDGLLASSPSGIGEILDAPLDGCPSPWPSLNELIYGFRPGQMVILASRPGGGKSAAACQIGYAAAQKGFGCHIFSHEMSAWDLWGRILCQQGLAKSQDFLHRNLTSSEKSKIKDFIENVAPRNLFISDRTGKTLLSLRSELARAKARHGAVPMVIIDYLQLMSNPTYGSNRFSEVSSLSRGLKALSVEFDSRFIVLAQLGRKMIDRPGVDPEPQISDLRESGDIEQDADIIIFPHRPSMFWKKTNAPPPDDKLIIAKQRRGPTGSVKVKYRGEHFLFQELA